MSHLSPDNLKWERTSCDWCGSSQSERVFTGPDRLEHLPGQFHFVRCTQCGLFRQDPRLAWESLQHYYPEDYASHGALVQEQRSWLKRLDRRYGPWKRVRAVERYQPGGRLLEVGCGSGLFLEEALRSGKWEVSGVEPSQRMAQYVRERLNIPVECALFANTQFPAHSFDVIAMWNVLEHLDHPIGDLRYAHRLLKDQGWLVLAIPNYESLEARLFGPAWVGWDLPRHLYIFPRPALHAILEELGFRWAGVQCISTSYATLGHSLDFWSQTWGARFPALRKLLLKTYYSLPGRLAMVPPLWVLDRMNRSTIITVFAQKIT